MTWTEGDTRASNPIRRTIHGPGFSLIAQTKRAVKRRNLTHKFSSKTVNDWAT